MNPKFLITEKTSRLYTLEVLWRKREGSMKEDYGTMFIHTLINMGLLEYDCYNAIRGSN